MKLAAIIPARFASSRFPGKPLVDLLGVPMIVRVADVVSRAVGAEATFVATDDDRISAVVLAAGYQVIRTSSTASTGTDRVCEAAKHVQADIYINVQGDEPLVDPHDIRRVRDTRVAIGAGVVNAMSRLTSDDDPWSVNIPKVAAGGDGRLIYMSRLPVPGRKDGAFSPAEYFKQVCIYAFGSVELHAFGGCASKARLEAIEDIEILRFLELGIPVHMIEVSKGSLAVDVPDDVPKVIAALQRRQDGTAQELDAVALADKSRVGVP